MTATPYEIFLADPLRVDLWLAETTYIDPADNSTGTKYWSTTRYGTGAADALVSTRFEARMLGGYNFTTSAPGDDGIGTVTGLLPARDAGSFTIAQKYGDLDELAGFSFDNQPCVIRHGGYSPRLGRNLTYGETAVKFNGRVEGQPLIGIDEATFELRNKDAAFEYPISTRKYSGGNWCLYFDGSGDFVDAGTNAAFNFTGTDFTIEFTLFKESNPGTEEVLISRGSPLVDGWDVRFGTAGALKLTTYQSGASQVTTSSAATLNKRLRCAMVRDGAAVTVYVEGVVVNVASGTHIHPTTASRNLFFGKNNAGTVFLNGFLDEIRIWNVARTRKEILTSMNRQLQPAEIVSSLVGYWKLDDGLGATASDDSATNADGTITNAVWRPSLQGGEGNEGSLLPEVWGARFGVVPVSVHEATRIYQVHSGPIQALVGVFEGLAPRTLDPSPGTTYTSLAAFLGATTAAGTYEVCSTDFGSWFRLGSNPSLPITIDIQGDKSGGVYRSKASDIVRYIVCNRGPQPLTDPTEIDDTAFDTLAAAATAAVGIDYSSEISIVEVVNFLLDSIGATAWFTREGGVLTATRFEGVDGMTATLACTQRDIELGTLEPLNAGAPVCEVALGYKKNGLVHTTGDIAGSAVGGPRYAFGLREWRILSATDDSVRETYKGAKKMSKETGLGLWADASAEAHRRLALYGEPPQAFKAFFRERATRLDRFSVLTLDFQDKNVLGQSQSRLSTSATAKFLVLAAEDDTAKGGTMLTLYRNRVPA